MILHHIICESMQNVYTIRRTNKFSTLLWNNFCPFPFIFSVYIDANIENTLRSNSPKIFYFIFEIFFMPLLASKESEQRTKEIFCTDEFFFCHCNVFVFVYFFLSKFNGNFFFVNIYTIEKLCHMFVIKKKTIS